MAARETKRRSLFLHLTLTEKASPGGETDTLTPGGWYTEEGWRAYLTNTLLRALKEDSTWTVNVEVVLLQDVQGEG